MNYEVIHEFNVVDTRTGFVVASCGSWSSTSVDSYDQQKRMAERICDLLNNYDYILELLEEDGYNGWVS